jgi:hypothetical protein
VPERDAVEAALLDQEAESLIGEEHDLSVGSVGPDDGVAVIGKVAVPEGTTGTIVPPLSGRTSRVLLDGASVPVGQPITIAGARARAASPCSWAPLAAVREVACSKRSWTGR